MNAKTFKSRVQVGALVLMTLTSVYLVTYLYRSFRRAYRLSLGEPERWQSHWRVEPDVVIELSTRYLYFSVWVTVILLSAIATLSGIYLLNRCRQGLLFDAVTAKSVQMLGALLIIAMIGDTIFGAVELRLITAHNVNEVVPIYFAYDPTDFKTMTLALVLFIFGWVMREAMTIEQTNREFV